MEPYSGIFKLDFRKFLLFIIAGIGYGLIQQGYHTLGDVVGAVAFGVATLVAFVRVLFPSIQKNASRFRPISPTPCWGNGRN